MAANASRWHCAGGRFPARCSRACGPRGGAPARLGPGQGLGLELDHLGVGQNAGDLGADLPRLSAGAPHSRARMPLIRPVSSEQFLGLREADPDGDVVLVAALGVAAGHA